MSISSVTVILRDLPHGSCRVLMLRQYRNGSFTLASSAASAPRGMTLAANPAPIAAPPRCSISRREIFEFMRRILPPRRRGGNRKDGALLRGKNTVGCRSHDAGFSVSELWRALFPRDGRNGK